MKQKYWLKRVKRKKGFVYLYRLNKESGIVDEDQRAFYTTRKTSRAQARKYVENLIVEKKQETSSSQLTFRKYADPFFIWELCPRVKRRLNEGKSIGKPHVKTSRRWLEMYVFGDIFSDLRMDRIKRADVLDLRERLKEKAGINTVNKVISTVKTVLSEAFFRDEIESDPGSRVGEISYKQKEKGILTREELSLLFSEIPGLWGDLQTYCVFNSTAKTGMRRSETLALPWNSLDFSEYTLDIYQAFKDVDSTLGLPKSGKKRIIPVVYSLIEPLKALQEESIRVLPEDLVFCYDTGQRLNINWWKTAFERAMDEIGLDRKGRNLTPHSLRHSLNSHLLAAGADPIKIRGYFGWSDLRQPILTPVQAGYTHWQPENLKDLLPVIDRIFEV